MIYLFLSILIVLNCLPLLTKSNFPRLEKILFPLLIVCSLLNLGLITLLFNTYHLKGYYTSISIVFCLYLLCILYFCLIKITGKKIITIVILIPVLVIASLQFIFGKVVYNLPINDNHKIQVVEGGILACGETIQLSKTAFFIFDKELHTTSALCLWGISKIEVLEYTDQKLILLIYHNGKGEKDNPYRYEIEKDKEW